MRRKSRRIDARSERGCRRGGEVDQLPIYALGMGAIALVVALIFYFRVKALPEGNADMARIARWIREGAMAFLTREYKVLAVYAVVVSGALFVMFKGLGAISAGAFLSGAFLSLLAGFFGMKAATFANVRTTEAARQHGMARALVTALDGGSVMGLCVAGLGLIGIGAVYFLFAKQGTYDDAEEMHRLAIVLHPFA